MPLPPLPASNTKRYKLLYVVGGVQHSLIARCSSAQTDGNALGFFNSQFAGVSGSLGNNVTWVGVDVALQGSDVFNPVSGWSPLTGTGGSPTAPIDGPRAMCFPGRTVGGRKSKVFLFGLTSDFQTPATYELDPLPGTGGIANFHSVLVSSSDFYLAIDGLKPVWYLRSTVKVNDHYVGLLR